MIERCKSELERRGRDDQGLGEEQVRLLIDLLDRDYLLSMPCSKKMQKKKNTLEGLRHLFYDHISGILGWTMRVEEGDKKGISPLLYSLIRQIWPLKNYGNNTEFRENNIDGAPSQFSKKRNHLARATRPRWTVGTVRRRKSSTSGSREATMSTTSTGAATGQASFPHSLS